MVDYFRLLERKQEFLDLYRDCLREAEEKSEYINACALNIQRLYRGVVSREKIAKKNYAAGEVQRVFRGLVGRKLTKLKQNDKLDNKQLSLFHYLCTQIQRNFRGYYSRKYKKDMRRRKDYCKFLEEKGNEVRAAMDAYNQEVAEREGKEADGENDEMFKNLASNLHHLVGTQQIPGVFRPPVEFNETPTMKGLPVEEHIRGVVKDLLRTRGITHRGLEADINGTLRIPLKGLKYRLSIQASAPYSALEDEARRKNMLHRILTKPKGDWFAGGNPKLLSKSTADPLSKGDVYMDPWANPLMVKGVPESQKQLEDSARQHKPLFVRKQDKPYVTRVGGNRSSTLPNDVFDTMAEAQETGGAIQRHMGTKTTRFGLPESADARNGEKDAGTIPKAPLRVTRTLRESRTTYGPVGELAPGRRSRQQKLKSKSDKTGFSSKPSTGKHSPSSDQKRSGASRVGEAAINDVWGSDSTLVMGSLVSAGGNKSEPLLSPGGGALQYNNSGRNASSYVDDESSGDDEPL